MRRRAGDRGSSRVACGPQGRQEPAPLPVFGIEHKIRGGQCDAFALRGGSVADAQSGRARSNAGAAGGARARGRSGGGGLAAAALRAVPPPAAASSQVLSAGGRACALCARERRGSTRGVGAAELRSDWVVLCVQAGGDCVARSHGRRVREEVAVGVSCHCALRPGRVRRTWALTRAACAPRLLWAGSWRTATRTTPPAPSAVRKRCATSST